MNPKFIFLLLFIFPFLINLAFFFSLSAGDRYYTRLQNWYLYAESGDWTNAVKLENHLDPLDIAQFKSENYPPELKKSLNRLIVKSDKTVEDWLELARIQIRLNYLSDALNSLSRAKLLDPIRDDITLFYSQLF